MNSEALTTYSAITVEAGQIRRVWFEAPTECDARTFCVRIGAGFEGKSSGPVRDVAQLPVAYNEETTRQLLGGISKSTLYRLHVTGKLDRLPGTARVMTTRSSIERYERSACSR